MLQKIVNILTNNSKEKDKRIKELWDALNHLYSVTEAYGHMDLYEANPDWRPPVYLHEGDYTMDDRLKDIRRHSIQIRKAAHDVQKTLLGFETEMIPPNY